MADNINVTQGSGKTIAADEISSVLHQRVKVQYGVDGSATDVSSSAPLPVTGTVDLGATDNAVLDDIVANQTDNSQKTQIVDASGNAVSVTGNKLDVNATASLSGEAIPVSGATTGVAVAVVDGSGNQVTSFGGGTQYTEADTDASITGTAMMMEGAGNALVAVQGTASDGVLVNLGTNNDITGTVTANAGTNLNTSALALESGGNLASIKAKTDNIPALGQALASASVPVILPAATITTLTPPAAITGFATSAKQDTIIGHVDGIETSLSSIDGKITAVNTGAVVVSSSALPTGASTAAKQPALGTAGTASADVITVQGIASMTALKVDGSAVTQPVSGTVTANLSATDNDVLDAIESDTTTIAGAVSGTEMQVDVVGALPAGTNAIGKLAANSGVDIGDVDVTSISAGTNLIGDVGIQPRTTNGLDTFMASGSDGSSILVATAQAVKASAGKVYGYYLYNPESAVTFVHFYNTASGGVTVGTTSPLFTLQIPPASAANLMSEIGITFGTAITIAATTTAGGNTAPATGVSATIWFK